MRPSHSNPAWFDGAIYGMKYPQGTYTAPALGGFKSCDCVARAVRGMPVPREPAHEYLCLRHCVKSFVAQSHSGARSREKRMESAKKARAINRFAFGSEMLISEASVMCTADDGVYAFLKDGKFVDDAPSYRSTNVCCVYKVPKGKPGSAQNFQENVIQNKGLAQTYFEGEENMVLMPFADGNAEMPASRYRAPASAIHDAALERMLNATISATQRYNNEQLAKLRKRSGESLASERPTKTARTPRPAACTAARSAFGTVAGPSGARSALGTVAGPSGSSSARPPQQAAAPAAPAAAQTLAMPLVDPAMLSAAPAAPSVAAAAPAQHPLPAQDILVCLSALVNPSHPSHSQLLSLLGSVQAPTSHAQNAQTTVGSDFGGVPDRAADDPLVEDYPQPAEQPAEAPVPAEFQFAEAFVPTEALTAEFQPAEAFVAAEAPVPAQALPAEAQLAQAANDYDFDYSTDFFNSFENFMPAQTQPAEAPAEAQSDEDLFALLVDYDPAEVPAEAPVAEAQPAEADQDCETSSAFFEWIDGIVPPLAQPAEAQPAEAQPAEAQPVEAQLTEAQLTEAQLTEAQPVEAQPAEAQLTEAQSDAAPLVEVPTPEVPAEAAAEVQPVEALAAEAPAEEPAEVHDVFSESYSEFSDSPEASGSSEEFPRYAPFPLPLPSQAPLPDLQQSDATAAANQEYLNTPFSDEELAASMDMFVQPGMCADPTSSVQVPLKSKPVIHFPVM